MSIFFESPTRQMEISLYCFAKGWETAYGMLRRRNIPVRLPWGNCVLNGASLGLIMFLFIDCPDAFRDGIRKLVSLLFSDI